MFDGQNWKLAAEFERLSRDHQQTEDQRLALGISNYLYLA
jgi:hypothetical protein